MRKRLGIISFFVVLFVSFIVVWNYSYYQGQEEAYIPIDTNKKVEVITSEIGVFERSKFALDYANMPSDNTHQRSLESYYENRAFHGAPPIIPHVVGDERNMGENSCLKCHQNGGYVEKFKAYSPVVPHSEKINCRQCHVPQKTHSLFVPTEFKGVEIPETGINNALKGSPPIIPHQIQLRENCLSCHTGPSAPKEIRVSHPERINCMQCHVINNKEMRDIGIFIRKINNNE